MSAAQAAATLRNDGQAAIKSDPLLGRVLDGRYRIESRLGSGGMGVVYTATRLIIGDAVAVKILHQEHSDDAQAAGRFRREAQTAARLKHPNAISVYDFGITADGLQYLVMELIEGHSLREIIKQQGRLLPTVVGEISHQLCSALDEAHRHNIVHRDIKPDNIIISQTPGGMRVKVLDFGIAKLRDQTAGTLTQTGSVMGTPHYMSPEQCLGEELDCRSDIYSLGCVLYEMLCGVVPFNAPISTAVIVQHVNQPPPSLREKNSLVTAEVERVVLSALEKKPEARPATAGAVALALSAALARPPAPLAESIFADKPPKPPVADHKSVTDDEETVVRDVGVSTPVTGAATAGISPTVRLDGPPGMNRAAGASAPMDSSATQRLRRRATRRWLAVALASAVVLATTLGTLFWLRKPEEDTGAAQAGRVSAQPQESEKAAASDGKSTVPDAAKPTTNSPPAAPQGMVYVAGGEFLMGRNDGDEAERPQHTVTVEPFFMDRYEVTCAEYQKFVSATRHRAPPGWANGTYPAGSERRPVVGVDWNDAMAYARWAGKRLPTEEEWEFAARGTDGRRYPWGNQWQPGLANAGGVSKGIADVGDYKGKSPSGVFDMVGNAWEWTASDWLSNRKSRDSSSFKVIRGGSYESDPSSATTTFRSGYPASGKDYSRTGFRCAQNVSLATGS